MFTLQSLDERLYKAQRMVRGRRVFHGVLHPKMEGNVFTLVLGSCVDGWPVILTLSEKYIMCMGLIIFSYNIVLCSIIRQKPTLLNSVHTIHSTRECDNNGVLHPFLPPSLLS